MTLETVVAALQTAVGGLTGIKYAPAYPPEAIGDFPFVVTYPVRYRGETNTPDDFRMLYDIQVELHVGRRDLPQDFQVLYDYPETAANAIFKALRDNSYAHAGIEGAFGGLGWNDVDTFGWYWLIKEVKIITTIT
jgi:hypothetical protein